MRLWAIRNIHSRAYLRNRDTEIMLFMSPESAESYIVTLPRPDLYEVVEFRR